MKARIIEDFSEMGFRTSYFDDISDALYYLSTTFSDAEEHSKDSHSERKTHRYLIIMDQIERCLSENKAQELEIFLGRVGDLINEEDCQNRIIHFIFAVPDLFVHQLGQALSKFMLDPRIYFLKKVDIRSVIVSILKQENIDYDEGIINDIVCYLLSTKNDDITNVHILFQMLYDTNSSLLVKRELIIHNYGSIEVMIEHMLKGYFKNKFSQLTDTDKAILKRACNYDGKGTHRVCAREGEDERLQMLADKNFVRFYSTNKTYEFVHDILAGKFYDDVLEEHDREINGLLERIHKDNLDSESLLAIQRLKDELAANELKDTDIANLIFAYMMNKDLAGETDYWMKKYVEPDMIIDELIRRIEKSVNKSGMIYVDMLSVTTRIPILFKCAKARHEWDKMTEKLRQLEREPMSYRSQCIASAVMEKSGYCEKNEKTEFPVVFGQIYHSVLIEPAYDELYRELYSYLLHYNLVDVIINERQMSRTHFRHILNIFLKDGKKVKFYSYEYDKKEMDFVKFGTIVSLITPQIVEAMESAHKETCMQFWRGNITFASKKIFYEKGGVSTELHTAISPDMLLKFSYKEAIAILFQKETPVIFLKPQSIDSHQIFTRDDVTNVIRHYKINFVKNYNREEFKKSLLMEIPEMSQKRGAWLEAREELERFFGDESANLSKYVPANIPGTKMSKLYLTLCYLNYLNLQTHRSFKFCRAGITLVQTEDVLKDTELYDEFYIELERDGNKQKFDPYGIAGIKSSKRITVDFHLITEEEKIRVKSYSIKKELEFLGNGSPAIAVCIGSAAECVLEEYRDAFSFRIMWDDKVSLVSQAIDAWEYELNKILVVLRENLFIKDLFVFGDIMKCRKTVWILNHYCKTGGYLNLTDKWQDSDEIKRDINMQYFQNFNLELLERVRLNIIQFETNISVDELGVQISKYFLENYNSVMDMEVINVEEDFNSGQIERECEDYLKSINCYTMGKNNAIQVDHIDDAYKAMLASLICFGNKQIDSAGKDILDMRGFCLTVRDIYQNGYDLSYRREYIDEYFETQWRDNKGVIKKIADSTDIFRVNQIELITEKLAYTVNHKLGNRKLMIAFYNPTSDSIADFKMPSLLNCFLVPRYQEEECILDVIFVWRTNECVLGLPMSLEAGVRWIYEKIILKLGGIVKIGNYTYFGVSMHCANNFIMRQMIVDVIRNDRWNYDV